MNPRRRSLFLVLSLAFSPCLLCAAKLLGATSPPKGAARRWQAAMPVGVYGQVNLRTGRVLTTLPIVSWSGRGPSMGFALFHNMNSPQAALTVLKGDGNFDGLLTPADIDPFIEILLTPPEELTPEEMEIADMNKDEVLDEGDLDLFLAALLSQDPGGEENAPDWRHSYSGGIHVYQNDIVEVIRDDGTADLFAPDHTDPVSGDMVYQPQPGVFDDLRFNFTNSWFTLTSKHQWKARYEATESWEHYRLTWLSDATRLPSPNQDEPANKVMCSYEVNPSSPAYGKLTKVTDASGRYIQLFYNGSGSLKEVQDMMATPRAWKLLYEPTPGSTDPPTQDGTGAFVALDDAMDFRIHWTYDAVWNITEIADKENHAFSLGYNVGRLQYAHDPPPLHTQLQVWDFYGVGDENYELQEVVCEYRDRRSNVWTARFAADTGNLTEVEDPLGHVQLLNYEYANADPEDPLAHEATGYVNEMNHGWDTGYDDQGNVIWTLNPMDEFWEFEYDTGGLNNLVSITGPEQGEYLLGYDVEVDATAVGSVTLPPGDTGGAGTVTLGYDAWSSGNKAVGKLRQLTDPIGCDTYFNYDRYGQLEWTREGVANWSTGAEAWRLRDNGGRVLGTSNIACRNCIVFPDPQPPDPNTLTFCLPAHCDDPNPASDPTAYCCCQCILECVPCDGSPDCPSGYYRCWYRGGCSGGGSTTGQTISEEEYSVASYTPPKTCKKDFGPPQTPRGPSDFQYDAMRRTTSGAAYIDYPYGGSTNEYATFSVMHSYDPLGRLTKATRTTNELQYYGPSNSSGPDVSRQFGYEHLSTQGLYRRTGPDGQVTALSFDEAGRAESIARSQGTTTLLSANVTHMDDDGLPTTIAFGNGTGVEYEFNLIRQLQTMRHFDSSGATLLQLGYDYNDRGLIYGITETVGTSIVAQTAITYDGRGRLTSEHRVGEHGYYYVYTYDQGGNRTTKVGKDPASPYSTLETTVYHYDVDDPNYFGSWNNRLMYYEVFDGSSTLVETIYYVYGTAEFDLGHVRWQIRKPASSSTYYGTQMLYDENGNVRYFSQNEWQLSGSTCVAPTTEVVTEVRGAGRGRYMKRRRDPTTSGQGYVVAGSATWTDYDGDVVYGDYIWNTSTSQVENKMSYLPGVGQYDVSASAKFYYHGDQIGSTRLMTDASGSVVGRFIYTAFGEKVYEDGGSVNTNPPATRYQYAGLWGYETFSDLPFVHVGYRWYDPATGRFLQRDPISIHGGLNVYAYTNNAPTGLVDPDGKIVPILIGIGVGLIVFDFWPQDANAPGPGDAINGDSAGPGAPPAGGIAIIDGYSGTSMQRSLLNGCSDISSGLPGPPPGTGVPGNGRGVRTPAGR